MPSAYRVAAPSIRIVPWTALASCWPLPQQLLPVSATGGGRRRCWAFSAEKIFLFQASGTPAGVPLAHFHGRSCSTRKIRRFRIPLACALGIFSGINILRLLVWKICGFSKPTFSQERIFRVSLYACPCTRARICFSTFCTSSWNIRADTRSAP